MSRPDATRWFDTLRTVLDRSHLWTPEDVPRSLGAALAPLGVRARIWLADHEQVMLRVLPEPGRDTPDPLPIDGSLAGRAFARVTSTPGRRRR